MGENTKIEWATHSWNPWVGCTKVSPGCDHCYAEGWAKRSGMVKWGPHAERRRTTDENWRKPLIWARKAREALEDFETGMLTLRPARPRVFCASLADVFDNQVPPKWRHDLFRLIWATPELDWLLLTKRPENIARMIDDALRPLIGTVFGPWYGKGWPNVWLGFTAEDQAHFDRRWPIIRDIPAAVRFCSYEPAIGMLRLPTDVRGQLHWLICGGESGPGHREMHPGWEWSVRDDCGELGISYFFKQMSGKKPVPEGFPVLQQFPQATKENIT